MKYGKDLIADLEKDIARFEEALKERDARISAGETYIDDCVVSVRVEEQAITLAKKKIELIKNGGCRWFREYATTDGKIVEAKWVRTKYGPSLRVVMPNGEIVWTTATTKKGLARKGLKPVDCLRPAWYRFRSSGSGIMGFYTGSYVEFPSATNYATGEEAPEEPIIIQEVLE